MKRISLVATVACIAAAIVLALLSRTRAAEPKPGAQTPEEALTRYTDALKAKDARAYAAALTEPWSTARRQLDALAQEIAERHAQLEAALQRKFGPAPKAERPDAPGKLVARRLQQLAGQRQLDQPAEIRAMRAVSQEPLAGDFELRDLDGAPLPITDRALLTVEATLARGDETKTTKERIVVVKAGGQWRVVPDTAGRRQPEEDLNELLDGYRKLLAAYRTAVREVNYDRYKQRTEVEQIIANVFEDVLGRDEELLAAEKLEIAPAAPVELEPSLEAMPRLDSALPDAAPLEIAPLDALRPLGDDALMTPPDAVPGSLAPAEGLLGLGAAGGLGGGGRLGGDREVEPAVAKALKWLAEHQLADGGWSFDLAKCPTCKGQCRHPGRAERARSAATGLALLSFLGAGETPRAGKYRKNVQDGLGYLTKKMKPGKDGGSLLEEGGNMYSHGIATLALCEAYALTRDRALQTPAQATVSFIAAAQDPAGGGWRYQPRQPGDTSVTGWQLAALRCGRAAGCTVPDGVLTKALAFFDAVQSDDGARYGYTGPTAGDATTAIGLLGRMHQGWPKDHAALERGVKWLSEKGPSKDNFYYNYYATQVMRHWEGAEWQKWRDALRRQLLAAQAKEGHEVGSWYEPGSYNDAGGRLYCTALAAMTLDLDRMPSLYAKAPPKEQTPAAAGLAPGK